jgi:hypothetical protein
MADLITGATKTTWKVEYYSDTGPDDEYFMEVWTVTDERRAFRSSDKADAEWLCGILNSRGEGKDKTHD